MIVYGHISCICLHANEGRESKTRDSVYYTRVNTVLAGLSTTTGSGKYLVAAVSIPLIVSRGWAIGGGCSQGCQFEYLLLP